MDRVILHSDMNCFYASVEMMTEPGFTANNTVLRILPVRIFPCRLYFFVKNHTQSISRKMLTILFSIFLKMT